MTNRAKPLGGALAHTSRVAMSSGEIDEFLSGRWILRLATIAKDGYPRVSPLWYYWDGGHLYITSHRSRMTYKDLVRDPRCSGIIDMDERPLAGMRRNDARAVVIKGDATLIDVTEVGPATVGTWFLAGPLSRPMALQEAIEVMNSRYYLSEKVGALGLSEERFGEMLTAERYKEAAVARENEHKVLVRITPVRITAWDFGKAPMG